MSKYFEKVYLSIASNFKQNWWNFVKNKQYIKKFDLKPCSTNFSANGDEGEVHWFDFVHRSGKGRAPNWRDTEDPN